MTTLKDWIKTTEKSLNKIKKLKSKDRLETLASIQLCNESIYSSVMGWSAFIQRPKVMNHFSDIELKKLLEIFKDIAVIFLETDIASTKKIRSKLPKQIKERGKKTTYIG